MFPNKNEISYLILAKNEVKVYKNIYISPKGIMVKKH